MMGRLNHDQRQLFYSFCLDEVVPDDHLRYDGEEQKHCEDDQVYDALKYRGPARA